MKYLLVLIVVVLGVWMLLRKGSGPGTGASAAKPHRAAPPESPALAVMVACAHCDLRLPEGDAQFDALGRPFCSEAHRRAGPR